MLSCHSRFAPQTAPRVDARQVMSEDDNLGGKPEGVKVAMDPPENGADEKECEQEKQGDDTGEEKQKEKESRSSEKDRKKDRRCRSRSPVSARKREKKDRSRCRENDTGEKRSSS